MIIGIRDIPFSGKTLKFTEADTDLREALGDIVRKNAIELTITLFPVEGGADLHGEIRTKVPMDCSFCTNEISIPVTEKFHELIMIGKNGKFHSKHGQDQMSDDLELSYVNNPEYNLTPLLREIVQSNSPIQPKCLERGGPEGSPKCIADWDYTKYSDTNPGIKVNPFSTLKNLSVKKK